MTPPEPADPTEPLDPFEQRLAAIPLRDELPPAWRARILATAREHTPRGFAALLWPHPLAWGVLAAGWIAVAALNFSGPHGEALYAATPPAAPTVDPVTMLAAMHEQHRLVRAWLEDRPPASLTDFPLDRTKL